MIPWKQTRIFRERVRSRIFVATRAYLTCLKYMIAHNPDNNWRHSRLGSDPSPSRCIMHHVHQSCLGTDVWHWSSICSPPAEQLPPAVLGVRHSVLWGRLRVPTEVGIRRQATWNKIRVSPARETGVLADWHVGLVPMHSR